MFQLLRSLEGFPQSWVAVLGQIGNSLNGRSLGSALNSSDVE